LLTTENKKNYKGNSGDDLQDKTTAEKEIVKSLTLKSRQEAQAVTQKRGRNCN
jgi:hypothetical protein